MSDLKTLTTIDTINLMDTTVLTRAYVEKAIRIKGAEKLESIQHPYSDSEVKSWPTQVEEAKLYLSNPASASTPLLDSLAAFREITKDDLVSKIMENVSLFSVASGAYLGQQQRLLDRLNVDNEDIKTVYLDVLNW